MPYARIILEEESPKDFFRTRRLGASARIVSAGKFKDLQAGHQFQDKYREFFTKVDDGHALSGLSRDTYVYGTDEYVFPPDWSVDDISVWLKKECGIDQFGFGNR